MKFAYAASSARVVFDDGARHQLAAELDRLGAARALVLSSPGQAVVARALSDAIGPASVGIFAGAVVHVPADRAEAARDHAAAVRADAYVAYGGGSAIGLAKAIALTTGHPIIALPTTFSGSEATPIYGVTEVGVKRTGRDPRVLPRTILYDPALYAGVPRRVAAPSGLNAIAHAVEALYAVDANPAISALAEAAIARLAGALPLLPDPAALADAITGGWLAGTCLGAVAMALHHKLCHAIGGAFDLPHAETHAILLPHALAYNAPAAPAAVVAIGRALGVAATEVPVALFDLRARLGVPGALGDLGMPRAGIEHIVDLAVAAPYPNPRPVERVGIRALLTAAFDGARP